MKKKLTLMFVALIAVAAFATTQMLTSRRAATAITIGETELTAANNDVFQALKTAKDAIVEAGGEVGDITINLAAKGSYTLSGVLEAPADLTINGKGATIDASTEGADNIIGIKGVTAFAKDAEGEPSAYSYVSAITIKDVTISGMKKALIRDYMENKTYLQTLTIDNCVIQASTAKPVVDFSSRGFVGKVVVRNSTIWAAAGTEMHFAKYGLRPNDFNNTLLQAFDVQNSTFVNIASKADLSGGANFNNFSQKGTANNSYTLKNNIFVNCGKNGQTVVGFNSGQTSATPTWDVDGNAFNWNGEDTSATEVSKAGKKDEVDIVQNCVVGVVVFEDAANGDFTLATDCAQYTAKIGDPRWIKYAVNVAEGITGGTVEVSPATAAVGEEVTVTATANEGYVLAAITVTGATSNEAVTVTNGKFKMIADAVNVNATFTKVEDITLTADDITDGNITNAIAAKRTEGALIKNLTITLAAATNYKVTASIEVSGNVTITGDNSVIDAKELTAPFIQMNPIALDATLNEKGAYVIDGITLQGVFIYDLPYQLIYGNKQKYLMKKILVENSIIGINGTAKKTIFDFNGGGNASEIIVNKSTLWANPSNAQNGGLHSSQSGHGAIQDLGSDKQLFAITNSTIYNIAYGKTTNSQRRNNTAGMEFQVEKSIIVNSGKSGQFIAGLNGGSANAAQTYTISGNVFNFDGADTSDAEQTKIQEQIAGKELNSLKMVVAFPNADNGVFNGVMTLGEGTQVPEAGTLGDPRWTLKLPAQDIEISPASGNITEALNAAKETGKVVRNITITLTPGANYTVTEPIEPAGAFVLMTTGSMDGEGHTVQTDLATIDASALTGPLVQMSTTPYDAADANGFVPVGNVGLINVKVTGLKNQLFYANKTKYLMDFHMFACVIEMDGGNKTVIDTNSGGVIGHLDIAKSTIASPVNDHTGALYSSQSGNKATEAGLEKQEIEISKSTIYNIAKGKNLMTHRQAGQKWLSYKATKSIFVNSGKSGQVVVGMNGGQPSDNPTWNINGNVFNFGGAETSATEIEKAGADIVQNSMVGVVEFTDLTTGYNANLGVPTLPETTNVEVGDPRWTVTPVQVAWDIVINASDITDGNITAAYTTKAANLKVGAVTINLAENTAYTVNATITAGGNVAINGAAGATIDASGLDGNLITLEGSEKFAMKADGTTPSDHYLVDAVTIKDVTVKGLKGALVKDNQKTYLSALTINNAVIQMPAAGKNVIDFNGKGYVATVTVNKSTIWAAEANTGFFAQYGSRPKNLWTKDAEDKDVPGIYDHQTFDVQNSTMVNIANGKNVCDLKQNGTAENIYTLKNNIFVNCGKSGQTVVGFNKGQASANPVWTVDGNVFNWGGEDKSAAEVEKAGKHKVGEEDVDIVQNSIAGIVTFTDVANGNLDANLELPSGVEPLAAKVGDPRWAQTYTNAPAPFYIIGNMNNWDRTAMTEMTFNAETQAYEYEYAPTTAAAFAFSDKLMTAEEAEADADWSIFNTTRYAIGEGDQDAKLNETVALLKVNGAILVAPGTYKISIAKDKSTITITGEVTPPTPVTVDKLYIMGTGTPKGWEGTTELTFNETTQAFEYEATVTTEDTYLTFGDAEWTSWDDFNGKHRYAPAEGNTEAVMNTEVQLVLVNDGNVLLKTPGTYKISVTKDLKMTITTGASGINGITVDGVSGDIFSDGKPVYNLSGQRVFKGYKGVVIKNGRKLVVK